MDTIDTAEPDEFARLLAQLNGDPTAAPPVEASAVVAPPPLLPPASAAPAPASLTTPTEAPQAAPPLFPHQPTASPVALPPATVPPTAVTPAAAAPPEAVPAPPTPTPVASSPFPASVPPPLLAPAFGQATPVPAITAPAPAPASAPAPAPAAAALPASPPSPVPSIAFPAVATPAPFAPPVIPPVTPPVALAPELMRADELAAPPPAAPTVAAPLTAPPALVTSPTPSPAPPWAPSERPGAPVDFAALLSTPVEDDGAPNLGAGPLMFGAGSSDAVEDETDIARSTLVEKIGLVLAVLIAPVGLIVGIVSAMRSVRRRGWVVGIVRATIAVGAVLSVALGIGGYYEYTQYQQQQHHDQIAAESAAFCATLKADPSMRQVPTFGWPAVASSIPDSLTAMQAFEDRWTKLAKVSPSGIRGDVTKEATAAKQIIDSVTVARVVDDASNVAVMTSVASSSGVPGWYSEYCE